MPKKVEKRDELNVIYGRVMTVLEAIGAIPDDGGGMQYTSTTIINYPETSKRNAIKSLISDAIFSEIVWSED